VALQPLGYNSEEQSVFRPMRMWRNWQTRWI
jgi:hypothetical protein